MLPASSSRSEQIKIRPGEERTLLRALREHFFSQEVNCLARGSMFMKLTHMPGVVADAIEWALLTPEVQRELVDRHLTSLAGKHAAAVKGSSS